MLRHAFGAVVFAGSATGPVDVLRTAGMFGRPRESSARSATGHGPESKEVVYRKVFNDHWPRVRRHIECYVDNHDEVDELTAEVFVVAWRKLDPARPMPLTWLLRTANNKLRDRTRRTRSHDRALEALTRGLADPATPLDPLEALALRQAVASLSARERQVVVLTYWDELNAGEVADVLRTSQAAVWTTLTRARHKLRVLLEGGES